MPKNLLNTAANITANADFLYKMFILAVMFFVLYLANIGLLLTLLYRRKNRNYVNQHPRTIFALKLFAALLAAATAICLIVIAGIIIE